LKYSHIIFVSFRICTLIVLSCWLIRGNWLKCTLRHSFLFFLVSHLINFIFSIFFPFHAFFEYVIFMNFLSSWLWVLSWWLLIHSILLHLKLNFIN
jgi:hypothetical protein